MNLEQLKYLHGPIMHQSWQWSSAVPSWLMDAIGDARKSQLVSEQAPLASLEEILIILFEASLEGPLSQAYYNMYGHVLFTLKDKYPTLNGIMDVFEAGGRLDSYEVSLLNSLRLKVRATVVRKSTFKKHGKKKKNETD